MRFFCVRFISVAAFNRNMQSAFYSKKKLFSHFFKRFFVSVYLFPLCLDVDSPNHHQSPQSGSNSPSAALNNSHKQNSLRNTKLARRARSFKDDVIGKIIQIRTPNNTLSLGR